MPTPPRKLGVTRPVKPKATITVLTPKVRLYQQDPLRVLWLRTEHSGRVVLIKPETYWGLAVTNLISDNAGCALHLYIVHQGLFFWGDLDIYLKNLPVNRTKAHTDPTMMPIRVWPGEQQLHGNIVITGSLTDEGDLTSKKSGVPRDLTDREIHYWCNIWKYR
jgi:hypothetical protein